eukprot:CAMPEP_0181047572 /NCGR_PEP_ID=MMETSP1070-20121207/14955_1 /TAXON_ID=265543 /ORGANISM="Minutocellus polymorphus, Strain NH13" /LENGTH=124 /DNA_ID=CAMNT_0023126261 /DNA_START=3 /DNA_END=374 /DNA_ORIENTATION=-
MRGMYVNSALDAAVRDEELKRQVQQEELAHRAAPSPSPQHFHQRNIDRVLPSLGGDMLEQATEMVQEQEQQDEYDDGNRVNDDDDDDDDNVPASHGDDQAAYDDDDRVAEGKEQIRIFVHRWRP